MDSSSSSTTTQSTSSSKTGSKTEIKPSETL